MLLDDEFGKKCIHSETWPSTGGAYNAQNLLTHIFKWIRYWRRLFHFTMIIFFTSSCGRITNINLKKKYLVHRPLYTTDKAGFHIFWVLRKNSKQAYSKNDCCLNIINMYLSISKAKQKEKRNNKNKPPTIQLLDPFTDFKQKLNCYNIYFIVDEKRKIDGKKFESTRLRTQLAFKIQLSCKSSYFERFDVESGHTHKTDLKHLTMTNIYNL